MVIPPKIWHESIWIMGYDPSPLLNNAAPCAPVYELGKLACCAYCISASTKKQLDEIQSTLRWFDTVDINQFWKMDFTKQKYVIFHGCVQLPPKGTCQSYESYDIFQIRSILIQLSSSTASMCISISCYVDSYARVCMCHGPLLPRRSNEGSRPLFNSDIKGLFIQPWGQIWNECDNWKTCYTSWFVQLENEAGTPPPVLSQGNLLPRLKPFDKKW